MLKCRKKIILQLLKQQCSVETFQVKSSSADDNALARRQYHNLKT